MVALAFCPLFAQVDSNYEITVIGKRDLRELTSATVTVINKEQFQGSSATLNEVIDEQAGIKVQRMGGLGEYSPVSIRGSTAEQVKVYMDGIPLNSASGSLVDLSKIPLSQVERIEIYKGSIPSCFQGGNGSAGVINIITAEAKTRFVSAQAGGGSFGTRSIGAAASRLVGPVRLLTAIDYQHSANDYEWLDDRGTTLGRNPERDDTLRIMENNDFTSYNGLLKASWQPFPMDRLEAVVSANMYNKGFFSTLQAPPFRSRSENNRNSAQASWNHVGQAYSLSLEGSVRSMRNDVHDPDGNLFYAPRDIKENSRAYGAKAGIGFVQTQQAFLDLLFTGERERYWEQEVGSAAVTRPNAERTSAAFSISQTLYLFAEKLSLNGSYTADMRISRADSIDFSRQWHATTGSGRIMKSYSNWTVGAKARLPFGFALKANTGTYYRVPDFFELYGSNAFFIGNAYLRPETSRNTDVTLLFNRCLPWKSELSTALSAFYNTMDDQIIYRMYAHNVSKPVNFGDVVIRGIEHELVLKRTTVSAGNQLTLMVSEIIRTEADQSLCVGKERSYLPRVKENAYVRWRFHSHAEAGYDLNFRSEYFKSEYNSAIVPLTLTHDLTLRGFLLGDQIKITAEIKNITDETIHDVEAFPLPGRAFYLTTMVQLHVSTNKKEF